MSSKRTSKVERDDDAGNVVNASMTTKVSVAGDENQPLLSDTNHSNDSPSKNNRKSTNLSELTFKFNTEEALKSQPSYCPITMRRVSLFFGIVSLLTSIVFFSIPLHFGLIHPPWSSEHSFQPQKSALDVAIGDLIRSIVILYLFYTDRIQYSFYGAVYGIIGSTGKIWCFRNYDSIGDTIIVFVVFTVSIIQCAASYLAARFYSTAGLSVSSIWKVVWPFFLPTSFAPRLAAFGMWSFLVFSQTCILFAPLQLAHIVELLSPLAAGGGEGAGDLKSIEELSSNASTTSSPENKPSGYIDSKELALAIALYAFLKLAPKIVNEFRDLLYCVLWYHAYSDLSLSLFHHIHSLPFDFHLNKSLGELVQTVGDGIEASDNLVHNLFIKLLPSLISTFVAFLIFTFHLDIPLIAGIAFLGFSSYLWVTLVLTSVKEDERDELAESIYKVRSLFTDSLLNYESIKVFARETYFGKKYSAAVDHFRNMFMKVRKSHSSIDLMQSTITNVTRFGCLLIAGLAISQQWAVPAGQSVLTVAKFIAINEYISSIFEPLERLAGVFMQIIEALIDLKDIVNIYELPTEEIDNIDAYDLTQDKKSHRVCRTLHLTKVDPQTGKEEPYTQEVCVNHAMGLSVEFKNVTFRYPTADPSKPPSLNNVSFTCPASSTVSFTGNSGSGKSSILRLLLRLYEPTSGTILIDGRDIKTISKQSLREVIGTVTQSSCLIEDTVANNLIFGCESATFEEAETMIKRVALKHVISSLPDSCRTVLSNGRLSGGETQRIALARALLKNPAIFLADEHTSALDVRTEREIMNATASFSEGVGRTSIYITHRLHTIVNCDQIFVLHGGEIAEHGTHSELLQKEGGMYRLMWATQEEHLEEERRRSMTEGHTRGRHASIVFGDMN